MKTKPQKKTILIALAGVTLFAVVLLAMPNSARISTEQEGDAALLVDTLQLNNSHMAIESEFAGTIISSSTVNIVPTVSGMVEEIYVQPGAYVEEGTELFRINDDAAQLSYDRAQATYTQSAMAAEISVNNAERSVITAQSSHNTLLTQRDNTNAELQELVDAAQAAVNGVNAAGPAVVALPLESDYDTDGIPGLSPTEQAAFDAKVAEVTLTNQTAQSTWQAQLTQAQSALDGAVQTRDEAYANFNSQISYAEQSLANAQNTVSAATNSGNAAMNVAGVGVATAVLQVEQYTITAPISGVVDFMNVNVGNMVSPTAIACSVSDHENLQVQFSVSESVKDELSLGQSIRINSNELYYNGTIVEIAPVAHSQTRLYTIVADIDATIDELPLNTTVKVLAERGDVENAIIVPYSALQFSADKTYVYLVVDGMAVQTAVTLGEYNHESVEILEGLSKNDVIITSWSESLRHGTPVAGANSSGQEVLEGNTDETN